MISVHIRRLAAPVAAILLVFLGIITVAKGDLPLGDPNYTGPSAPTVDLPALSLPAEKAFVHPGLLQSQANIDFIRARLAAGEEPWTTSLKALKADKYLALDRKPKIIPVITTGTNSVGYLMADSSAAYGFALLWCITGDKAYADKAIETLNAGGSTLTSIVDPQKNGGQKLLAGFTGCKYASAAELIAHYKQPDGSTANWAPADQDKFKTMLNTVFYPEIKDFQPGFNGNWDASMYNTMMCIAVFSDDHAMFNRAVDYFLHGKGHGSISHYFYASGQNQETVRDQGHVQLGLSHVASACEIAWKQGLDLYSMADNRLATGYEYTAKYLLGNEVETVDNVPASTKGRDRIWPVYEIAYQHYVIEKGLPMPYTKQILEKEGHRPEGMDLITLPAWGTLALYRGPATAAPKTLPAPPAKP